MPNGNRLDYFLGSHDVVIFDLDGVIVDSADLKVQCMRETLSDFSFPLVETYLVDFRKNFGQSRSYHFKNFYNNYLKREHDFNHFYEYYSRAYAEKLSHRYSDAPMGEGAAEIISLLSEQGVKLFVATGTATAEAEQVLTHKKVRMCFEEVYGSPIQKKDAIATIITEQSIPKQKIIMVGDAVHDRDSAWSNDINFLFVEQYAFLNRNEMAEDADTSFYVVKNLKPTEHVMCSK